MICYLRSSTIGYDSRLRKYIFACKTVKMNYMAITWNRLLDHQEKDCNEYQFQKYAPYGHGHRLLNFWKLIMWYFFITKILLLNLNRFKIIHACNIETAFIAYIFKLLFKKSFVFDIYDTSGKYKIERYFAKHADLFILPHKKRLEQIKLKETD